MKSGWWILPILSLSLVFWGWVAFSLTIEYDMGGPVLKRIEQMHNLRGVQIVGECYSACTLYLGLPETCVSTSAKLGFHGPSTKSGLPLLPKDWETITNIMASYYPKPLAEWFLSTARHSTNVIYLSGEQVIALGAKSCN